MPSYSYKAFDSEGSIQSGFINADSERSARKEIKSLNLIPHKLKKIKSQTTKRFKIKNKDLVLATRQIGTLLEAAAQIDEALKMTAEQVKNKDLKNILFNLRPSLVSISFSNSVNSFQEYLYMGLEIISVSSLAIS